MSESKEDAKSPLPGDKQRDMLEQAEQEASKNQPESFQEEANADKVVSIPPAGPGEKPIRGLDPK